MPQLYAFLCLLAATFAGCTRTPETGGPFIFDCGSGRVLTASFGPQGEEVHIAYDGKERRMKRQTSGSEATRLYADDSAVYFTLRGKRLGRHRLARRRRDGRFRGVPRPSLGPRLQ